MTQTSLSRRTGNGPLALHAMQRQAWARLERDPLWHRVPGPGRKAVADQALQQGWNMCEDTVRRLGRHDPQTLAGLMGVPVVDEIAPGETGPLTVISEYRPRPAQIVLYTNVLRACRDRMRDARDLPREAREKLAQICMAHELYHHVDRTASPGRGWEYRVTVFHVGVVRIHKKLAAATEVAAHAFSACLLGLNFLPSILDEHLAGA